MIRIGYYRIFLLALLLTIIFSDGSFSLNENTKLHEVIADSLKGRVYLETGQMVNVSTTIVEASIFTPNVTTAEVEVNETSLETTEFKEESRSDIISILIIMVLTGLIFYIIYRKRRLLQKP